MSDLIKDMAIKGGVFKDYAHDSGHKHVSGEAQYIDDIIEPQGTLHAYFGTSSIAHGTIKSMDLAPVRAYDGVVDVIEAKDIPGINDICPTGRHDEPVLTSCDIQFHGQPIFAVVAKTRDQARRAARLADIIYEEKTPLIDVDDAHSDPKLVFPPMRLQRGDEASAIKNAPRQLSASMRCGGQDHFYLEGHIAFVIPGEDGDVQVFSSTQHPSEVQHMVSHVLGKACNGVTVDVRRMGGGFGGKETQGNAFAAIAALAALRNGRAVKIRPDRDDDMISTGKRHDFKIDYTVGFDDEGHILGVDFTYAARCGFCADLSGPVTDRALFHCDNAYYWPAVRAQTVPIYTNTVSATAFRGFGGPQGVLGAERVIEEVAFATGLDALEVRKRNFYGDEGRNITPYHQKVEDNIIGQIVDELEKSSDYQKRRSAIHESNAKNSLIKRGIALTPVKFGISFTLTAFNKGGALIHIYSDGSVQLNHGGTEMGQGLYTKVAQVVAHELQIDIDQVKITATSTGKVPNTAATAASSGTDLNGMAALDAAQKLKKRLVEFACSAYKTSADKVKFLPNRVSIDGMEISFKQLIDEANMARVALSATGFYQTPKIHWNRETGRGHPFYYFSYGACVSEVAVDTLTGEYQVERVDILHDCGASLNPALDQGQIEGGFVQGMGWLTTEELVWDNAGKLRTHAPSTYKIPLASDRPKIFNVALVDWSKNFEPTIHRSKAVGEPPFMLATSVLHALSDAVAAVGNHDVCPRLDAPATPEAVLMAMERIKTRDNR